MFDKSIKEHEDDFTVDPRFAHDYIIKVGTKQNRAKSSLGLR